MKNAVAGVGLAPDAAMVTFPVNMFLPGSDIDPLKQRRREIYEGLTGWKSEFIQTAGAAKMLEVGVPSAGVQTVRPISGGRWPTMLTPERCGLRISAEWMAAVAAGPARLSKRHELPVDTLSPIRT